MSTRLAAAPSRVTNGSTLPFAQVSLELLITDPDLVKELREHAEGQQREDYALCALRIGLLALKQARGQLDGDTIRREGAELLGQLGMALNQHAVTLENRLSLELKSYFDPESGKLPERIQRLVMKDGELEQSLRKLVGVDDSELCKTLLTHFGSNSPLMKLLSPKESEGLLAALRTTLTDSLTDQRQRVLTEFSLDNKDGALSRLVANLQKNHGDLSKDLEDKISDVVKEFSLDKKDSALSRLVRRVTKAQRTISKEFSLDNEQSALCRMSGMLSETSAAIRSNLTLDDENSSLSRLKKELLTLITQHTESNHKFQIELKEALAEMKTRKTEAERSTQHGRTFERAVFEFVQSECQRAGEVATFEGDTTGLIKNCKVGDTVIELGPDHAAAGAKIVLESKDKERWSLPQAREEIEKARKNRGACVGIFAYARSRAPEGLDPFQRIGDDVFVIWDAEDPHTDLYLRAALMVARALCTRQAKQREAQAADFQGMEKSINDIEKKASSLDEIRSSAETIQGSATKILDRVRIARKGIEDEVANLRDFVSDLKASFAAE